MLNRRSFLSAARAAAPRPDGRDLRQGVPSTWDVQSAGAHWVHLHRAAMACRFEITLPPEEPGGVVAARLALDEIDRLEDQLSVYRPASDVSNLNRTASMRPVPVEQRLFELLRLSQEIFVETEGAFDITAGPLVRCWGFFQRQGAIPQAEHLEAARQRVGMNLVKLDDSDRTVHFLRDGIEINLGSIGKGYALDCAAEEMRRSRVTTALLSGGSSSVLALGAPPGTSGWLVGIRHPRRHDARLARVLLRQGALATSATGEQHFEFKGKRYGHILDPRSGWPARGIDSVTVVARSAARADALATAFFVGGRDRAERYCAEHPDVLALILEEKQSKPVLIGKSSLCQVNPTDESY